MGKKIRNKDIATRLGVSGTLVSLVLNHKADQHGIKKETQERVFALARQMGYYESKEEIEEPVEEQTGERPGVIGMIVPSLNDPFIYEITPYLQKAFASIGVAFSLVSKDPEDSRYGRLISGFKKFYSGLILVGDAADDYTIRALNNADYPFVLLEKTTKKLRLNTISIDIPSGTSLIANHIESLGYKNIVVVKRKSKYPSDNEVLESLKAAIKEKPDINVPLILEFQKLLTEEPLEFSMLEKYLRPPYRTDLFVVYNADLVYPLLSELQKHNVRVPQDVAVISLEEGPGFELIHPPVTTLRKPLSSIALKLAKMTWSEVKNQGKGKYRRQVNLQPELLVRKSCGSLR
jgi:LacI family transcriptional regulator